MAQQQRSSLRESIERALTRAGHIDLVFFKTNLFACVMSGIPGITVSVLAWFGRTPLYITLLSGMLAMTLVSVMTNQVIKLVVWLRSDTQPAKRPRRKTSINTSSVATSRSVVFGVVLAALLSVSLMYAVNGFIGWKHDKEGTYVVVTAGVFRLRIPDKNIPMGIYIYSINAGTLPITGPISSPARFRCTSAR